MIFPLSKLCPKLSF